MLHTDYKINALYCAGKEDVSMTARMRANEEYHEDGEYAAKKRHLIKGTVHKLKGEATIKDDEFQKLRNQQNEDLINQFGQYNMTLKAEPFIDKRIDKCEAVINSEDENERYKTVTLEEAVRIITEGKQEDFGVLFAQGLNSLIANYKEEFHLYRNNEKVFVLTEDVNHKSQEITLHHYNETVRHSSNISEEEYNSERSQDYSGSEMENHSSEDSIYGL